jgi:hypothetical protein
MKTGVTGSILFPVNDFYSYRRGLPASMTDHNATLPPNDSFSCHGWSRISRINLIRAPSEEGVQRGGRSTLRVPALLTWKTVLMCTWATSANPVDVRKAMQGGPDGIHARRNAPSLQIDEIFSINVRNPHCNERGAKSRCAPGHPHLFARGVRVPIHHPLTENDPLRAWARR